MVLLSELKRLVHHDWRTRENAINESLAQFTLDIPEKGFETLNTHFVHQRSEVENVIPLLFVHGCKCMI